MKMRTKKIVAKRFRITKNGIILRTKQNAGHLKSRKSKRQLRKYNVLGKVSHGFEKTIRTFLPYQ